MDGSNPTRPRYNRSMQLSIIIPALNEAHHIAAVLLRLQPLRARGVEVIVVDGGSADGTASVAAPLVDRVIVSTKEQAGGRGRGRGRGRARQMNAGAALATGDVLLFLHADSILPDGADELILRRLPTCNRTWGRFNVSISGTHFFLPVIAWFMNWRSRLTGVATGDQAIFMTRLAFDAVGGFPDQLLMEDVEITSRLKKRSAPLCLREKVITSGRRWEKHGVWRTIGLMWRLRCQYALGAAPADLHRSYYGNSEQGNNGN